MNKDLSSRIKYAGRFFHFLLHAGNRYRIHSPYLYSFIDEVLRKDTTVDGGGKIEGLRRKCLNSNEIIQKTDYGTGLNNSPVNVYPVRLRNITKASLTSPRYARRLFRLARHLNAGNMLEIGTSLGFTTAYLALANPRARIITLEGCPELCRLAREHFKMLGITNIEVMEGRFEDTLQEALAKLNTVDLVYIDGNHKREATIDYYEKCMAHSHNNTIMVFDDIHASSGMEEAWEHARRGAEISISLDLFFTGLVFCRNESSRQHFRLRYI